MDRRYKKRLERYWSKMLKQGINTLNEIDLHGWFDLWHVHSDWLGKGNRFPESKLRAAEISYELLLHAEKLIKDRQVAVQAWLIVAEDSADNALYLHSKNPNGSAFPYAFEGCHWGLTEIPYVDLQIDLERYEIGMYEEQDEPIYFIRSSAGKYILDSPSF